MSGLALAQRGPVYGALVACAGVAVGAALIAAPQAALGAVGLLVLVMLATRLPTLVPVYLMALSVGQPILMRFVAAEEGLLVAVKRLDEVSLAILLPLALARHAAERQWPLPRWTLVALVALTALGGAGTLLEGTPVTIAALDAFLLFRGFVFFVIISAYPLNGRAIRVIASAALAIALAIVGFGLLELVLPGLARTLIPFERTGERLGLVTLVSVFNHEGQSGWFFAFFATACYGFYLAYRRAPLLVLTGLFALCTVLTLRRKAIAGLVVMLAVAALIDGRRGAKTRALLVGVLLIGLGVGLFGGVVTDLFSQGYDVYVGARDPSRVARNAMYIASFRIATDHFPFGVGFGRFGGYAAQLYYSPVYFEYGIAGLSGHRPQDPRFLLDTFWPHVLGQFGFFGVPLFAWAMGAIWWPLVRLVRERASPLVTAMALACLLTMVEALVESVALQVFEATLSAFFLFGLPALLYAHLRHGEAAARGSAS